MKDFLLTITEKRHVDRYWELIEETMARYDINTERRRAHFLSQILHESGRLRYSKELWGPTPQQKKYEKPYALAKRLGNTNKGDGERFRGRGLIQLTGRKNYQKYADYLAEDVGHKISAETVAEWLEDDPYYQVDVAGWYWETHNLNSHADRDDSKSVTQIINGGYNGLADREELLSGIQNFA